LFDFTLNKPENGIKAVQVINGMEINDIDFSVFSKLILFYDSSYASDYSHITISLY
jgi:hypothetical protein